MKVGCNLLWLVPGGVGGTETATVSLLREIAADPPDDVELTLYALDAFGQTYPELVAAFPTQPGPLTGRLRPLRVAAENTWLARQVQGEVDLVHHMGGVLPPVPGAPGVVTIHDLQPFDMPENFTPTKRTYLQRSIPRSVRRAAGVLAPSEFVRRGSSTGSASPATGCGLAPWGVEAAQQRGERRPGPGPLRPAPAVVRVPVVHLEPQEPRPAAAGLRLGGGPRARRHARPDRRRGPGRAARA